MSDARVRVKPDLYFSVSIAFRAVRRLRRALSVAGEPDGDPLRRLRLREIFCKCPSLRRGETETARAVIGPLTK